MSLSWEFQSKYSPLAITPSLFCVTKTHIIESSKNMSKQIKLYKNKCCSNKKPDSLDFVNDTLQRSITLSTEKLRIIVLVMVFTPMLQWFLFGLAGIIL